MPSQRAAAQCPSPTPVADSMLQAKPPCHGEIFISSTQECTQSHTAKRAFLLPPFPHYLSLSLPTLALFLSPSLSNTQYPAVVFQTLTSLCRVVSSPNIPLAIVYSLPDLVDFFFLFHSHQSLALSPPFSPLALSIS